ncbi:MAG: metalloprotease TldD [Nitrospiraceae bacterium]|nr:metalloprotease TldD [Nitrospiraceae bacterium]
MTTPPRHDIALFFEHQFGTSPRLLEGVLGSAVLSPAVDDADLYFEYTVREHYSIEDGIVKKAGQDVSQGVGARIVAGERTGFAFTEEFDPKALTRAVESARRIADKSGNSAPVSVSRPGRPASDLYPVTDLTLDRPVPEKIAVLETLDRLARAENSKVVQVMASLASEIKTIQIVRKDGTIVADRIPLTRINISVIVQEGDNRQTGTYGWGGRTDFGGLVTSEKLSHAAREAVRQALVNLSARPCPSGTMNVVLGPGWPGILLHEAIGHGLEGDFNRKGTSAFSGRLGERVASPLCTIIDDGTIPGRRGSLNVDDEGTPTQRTVLIENGILRGYLQDRQNARLMGAKSTGNGRRESYAHPVMPRMTNTVMLAGESDPGEILSSLERGIYAVNFGGGQVDITSGKFVFSMSEAYYVENGRILYPVKGATLIGNGPEVLTKVRMVGNDMALDTGVGTCGKDGQSVPVGVGLPTLRVDGITVGGTH